jgi:hypothetical protein
VYSPISPQRKRGVEYWKSFPLSSVDNIRRWEQDCRSLRRSSRSSISNASIINHSYDADTATMMDSSALSSPSSSKRLKRSADDDTAAFDGHRPAAALQQPRSEEDLSSEEIQSATSTYGHPHNRYRPPPPHHHHPHMNRSEQQDPDQDRDAHRLSPPEESGPAGSNSSSYYVVDHHNALSQLTFLKGGGGSFVGQQQPSGPPQLSSWDAAPPIKFQQQFLW